MPQNTINDFLKTIDEIDDITCPMCGTPLGIRKQGSYEMILTVNARKEINDILSLYRRYLQGVEDALDKINTKGFDITHVGEYPHKDRKDLGLAKTALYETKGAKKVLGFIETRLDYYNWSNLSNKIIALDKINENTSIDVIINIFNVIFNGFEPDAVIGSAIIDLIFDQHEITHWIQGSGVCFSLSEKGNQFQYGNFEKLLSHSCPRLFKYLEKVISYIREEKNLNEFKKQLTNKEENQEKNQDEILRILEEKFSRTIFVLVLIFGHKHKEVNKLTTNIIEYGIPFDFPKIVYVSLGRLKKLLRTDAILKRKGLSLSEDYISGVMKKEDTPEKQEETDVIFFDLMRRELKKLVHFSCTGLPSSTQEASILSPEESLTKDSSFTQETSILFSRESRCGWYPKQEITHPVVLIGSPGTSKSTVMLTGLTTFYMTAANFDKRVVFTSDEDVSTNEKYARDFWDGILPTPTKVNSRNSIQLAIESIFDETERTNFVFTDIPGEIAARSMTEKGTHPLVLSVLKHTETVVFFFDLSIEDSIRSPLICGKGGENWKELSKNFESVANERTDINKSVSRASVSQFQLLAKIIQDLRDTREQNELKEIKFICVIPKADLFVAEQDDDDSDMKFFTKFYNEMKERNLLLPSRFSKTETDENGFKDYHSWGAAGLLEEKDAKGIIRDMSDSVTACLSEIGNALGKEAHTNEKKLLNTRLSKELIETLNTVFTEENVYTLAVSAQGTGKTESTQDNPRKRLGHPPNQKFSEFVFIIPMILSSYNK